MLVEVYGYTRFLVDLRSESALAMGTLDPMNGTI